jgi:hypothetical protein
VAMSPGLGVPAPHQSHGREEAGVCPSCPRWLWGGDTVTWGHLGVPAPEVLGWGGAASALNPSSSCRQSCLGT